MVGSPRSTLANGPQPNSRPPYPIAYGETSLAQSSRHHNPSLVLAPLEGHPMCSPASSSVTLPQQQGIQQRSTHLTLSHGHHPNSPSSVPQQQSPQPHIVSRRPSNFDRPASPQQSAYPPSTLSATSYSSTSVNGGYDRSGYDRRFSTDTDPADLRRSSVSTIAPSPLSRKSEDMRSGESQGSGYMGGYQGPRGSSLSLQRSQSRYRIEVRQQPAAARACGFGERDRRVIDPPPIVQLIIDGNPGPAEIRYPFNVVHCTLWSVDGQTDETLIPSSGAEGRITRRLMGTLVSSPFVGVDENNEEGCFFCFPDLSCRTHGQYRLKFKLMRLEPTDLTPNGYAPIVAEVISDIFSVYTAKEFPGMKMSTALTKTLKRQGCNISVKKGNDKATGQGTGGSGKGDLDGDDSGDNDSVLGRGGSKDAGKRRRKT